MKKLIDRLGLPRVIGIAGLALLIVIFLISLLFQNRKIQIGSCDIIFAGTENDADCCIMISDGSCLVIDTGEEADGHHIVEILREKGIETINCLILSHPDNDHIGGASLLADTFDIEMVIMPYFGKYRDKKACALAVSRSGCRLAGHYFSLVKEISGNICVFASGN